MKELKNKKIKVLDKGFIKLLDVMGDEGTVVDCARISFGKDSYRDSKKDSKLRERLLADKHTSPFEMPKVQLEVKCPIFVARQWFRHRYGNYNEESLRYRESECEFYFPKEEDIRFQNKENKQGRGDDADKESKEFFLNGLKKISKEAEDLYKEFLSRGLARELSRIILPVNLYTRFIWCVDLKTLMHFINLRMEECAQYEIRCYAEAIHENILKEWCPEIFKYFEKYILFGKTISKSEIEILKKLIKEKGITLEDIENNDCLRRLLF